ncbi:MAG: acylphosphatase [Methanothrix sp.]
MARALGLKGFVENLDDGRVRIVAEEEEDRLKWFEDASFGDEVGSRALQGAIVHLANSLPNRVV